MPSRCIVNLCRIAHTPDCLKTMTEVESTLIAFNLQFKKIHRLPKTLWPHFKDRVINVPVPARNVKQTIQKLPRNPSDSGLIGVNFKRKVSYKNTHKRELVDLNRIFKGWEHLIQHNPLYKDSEIDRDFLNSCKANDPSGHDFFIAHINSKILWLP